MAFPYHDKLPVTDSGAPFADELTIHRSFYRYRVESWYTSMCTPTASVSGTVRACGFYYCIFTLSWLFASTLFTRHRTQSRFGPLFSTYLHTLSTPGVRILSGNCKVPRIRAEHPRLFPIHLNFTLRFSHALVSNVLS